MLKKVKDVEWQVFSKHSKKLYREKNILISPINNKEFIKSMITCKGVLCGAGFETPAEALFLQKKLMVIPMKGQYEQQCNAAALEEMGVPVLKKLKDSRVQDIADWVYTMQIIPVDFPNIAEQILDMIFEKHFSKKQKLSAVAIDPAYAGKKLRKISLGNVLHQITG